MDTEDQIPPPLPLQKGVPRFAGFAKEGRPACAKPLRRRQGGDFLKHMSSLVWTP